MNYSTKLDDFPASFTCKLYIFACYNRHAQLVAT